MMTKASLFETRSNFSQIINKVMHGEEHLVLRKNIPVARIVPVLESVKLKSKELIERIQAVRSRVKKVSIKELNEWKKVGRL